MRVSAILGALFLTTGMTAVTVVPATAAAPAVPAVSVVRADTVPAAKPADLAYIRLLAGKDARSTVRAVAWSALVSSSLDAAVARFLASDYAFAVARSAQTTARNLDFAQRVLATHTEAYAPQVHAAAKFAVSGTPADRERFARTGYAAAKERDRLARESNGEQAAALAEADRDFIRLLADTDPGPQVRGAAAWAVRAGAVDGDAVEFFAYGWANGAALDLAAHGTAAADREVVWRATANQLEAEAKAAEQAARDAGAEGAAQARDAAARAWRSAAEQTGPATVAWADAERVAAEQAENWRRVTAAAVAGSGPNWKAVTGFAATTEQEWAAEQQSSIAAAKHWTGLLEQALAGERRVLDMR